MSLPNLNDAGELPEGLHQATIDEVIAQFGRGTSQQEIMSARLRRIHQLAKDTNHLQRLIIFGSYITSKPEPNDIDLVLIFDDDFDITTCAEDEKRLLNH